MATPFLFDCCFFEVEEIANEIENEKVNESTIDDEIVLIARTRGDRLATLSDLEIEKAEASLTSNVSFEMNGGRKNDRFLSPVRKGLWQQSVLLYPIHTSKHCPPIRHRPSL